MLPLHPSLIRSLMIAFFSLFCYRYTILPALSIEGYFALRIVEGSINREMFLDFVRKEVVSFLPPLIPALYLAEF